MKERPILFNAPMVRALLAGTKTQTRRSLKVQPTGTPYEAQASLTKSGSRPVVYAAWERPGSDGSTCCICPYGVPGDRLWVREAFIYEPADYCWEASVSIPSRPAVTTYRADIIGDSRGGGWKPSIHMPRSLSRILLEVTDVRVERVQDISEADAQAEGCVGSPFGAAADRILYQALWEQINGPGSWDLNPWVWVVSFKRVTP